MCLMSGFASLASFASSAMSQDEISTSGLATGVDVAVHCQTTLDDDVGHPTANVEQWHPTLQELCKNQPTQHHPYLANPIAATQQAYGLWSSQLHPPLLTPYGPMPFFGGFFPGPYPLPTSLTPVKPEDLSEVNKGGHPQGDELQERKKQKLMMTGGGPAGSTPRTVHGLTKAPTTGSTMNSSSESTVILRTRDMVFRCSVR